MIILKKKKTGSVLILSLWTLAFLTVLAVQIGLTIRQRATLLARIEQKSQLRNLAGSGIKQAIAVLARDADENGMRYTANGKIVRHNNPAVFANRKLGNGYFEVSYDRHLFVGQGFTTNFGVVDEESKININTSDWMTISRIMRDVLGISEEEAQSFTEAIIDWSEPGKLELNGFYSDDYYFGLEIPYRPKNAPFQVLDEIMLVRGFSPAVIEKLKPYVTIYGDGLVNINTASEQVLIALGLDAELAEKVIGVRNGPDGLEFTSDDYIFNKSFDVVSEMKKQVKLSQEEMIQLDSLNSNKKIKTNSSFYMIKSTGKLEGKDMKTTVSCVYNLAENSIEYWREK